MPESKSAAAPAAPRKRTATKATATTGNRLVIVESPAKAKKIAAFLGPGYIVESSIGHIRDLPRNAADVPPSHKGEAWARLGVDVDHDFQTLYVVSADKKQQVAKLKALLKEADELFLATDEDREGEAIAWHLLETLKPKVPVRRMVFHEITPQAIQQAVEHAPRARHGRWSTRRRPGACSTGCTATRSARCCGRRSCRSCRRAACSRWRPGSSSSASGPGCGSCRPATGTSTGRFAAPATQSRPDRARARMTATLVALDGKRLATGVDFEQETGQLKAGADVVLLDEAERPRAGRAARPTRRSRSGRSRRSPTPASPTRRS